MQENPIGKKRISIFFNFIYKQRKFTLNLKNNLLKNNKGQFAIEAILLMSVTVGLFIFFTKTIKEKQLISNLFSRPINSIKNMTTFGTWKENCTGFGSSKSKQTLANCHPNSITRGLSSNPNL